MTVTDIGYRAFRDLERAANTIRQIFATHHLRDTIMQHLDDLIAAGRKLKDERATLLTDRDAQKARADKAEADLATLQGQVSDDEM